MKYKKYKNPKVYKQYKNRSIQFKDITKKNVYFDVPSLFFFENFTNVLKYFGVFVKEIVIFYIGFGFCVFDSIWEHRLKIFFDPKNRTNRPPENRKKPRSVNNFRTEHLG